MPEMIVIHNLVNPKTGKTWKQENLEKQHNIPLGTLVEERNGARMFVVRHSRDCDGTPLYVLSPRPDADRDWQMHGGYPEYWLTPIQTVTPED